MKPRRISKRTHKLELECFDEDALKAIHTLRKAGHIAYIVGGSIRDLLLGNQPKDFDISTSAKPEEIKKLFRNCILIGRRFRLAHLRYGKKILEVATFRKGDTEKGELIVQDNVWGSPEEDVIRRDFTINALFYDSESETIIDYVGGYKDAENRFLQTIGDPYIRFKQDPVRMIRCLKFQARFRLQADGRMHQALEDCRQDLVNSSQARIFEELVRMLESGSSRNFYHLMHRSKLLEILQPVLATFLSNDKRFEIFSFLDEADVRVLEGTKKPTRPILLSCLVFPILNKHILQLSKKSEKTLHLGQVQKETSQIIDSVFQPFFHLPKRIKAKMVSLLTTQFRLVPLDTKVKTRIRIPRTPDFPLGLEFLELRSRIEPGYRIILEEWTEAYKKRPQTQRDPKRRGPRRSSSYRKRGPKK
ncbi:MAG: Poly(A) polymerase I [Chlamydiia bacterium]|nr:Poly(A) polymerase I [Chlamydiia bacterium]